MTLPLFPFRKRRRTFSGRLTPQTTTLNRRFLRKLKQQLEACKLAQPTNWELDQYCRALQFILDE